MKSTLKTGTVRRFLDWDRDKILAPNHEYQRGAVWTPRQQKLLIDSLFRGYPIPLFYFHFKEHGSGELGSKRYEIIDGQQRVNALASFFSGGLKLFDPQKEKVMGVAGFLRDEECPWGGRTFETLPESLQE